MEVFVIQKTDYLIEYLDSVSRFHSYEVDGDFIVIKLLSDVKIFWLGVGYGQYIDRNKS